MRRLEGKAAIVTGGAMGIGGATARRLAEEGARVLIADINQEAAEANARVIRESGGTVATLAVDVGKHADIRAMVDAAVQQWGKLDLLINNAYSSSPETRGS